MPTNSTRADGNFTQRKAHITISYLEIYNENVNDLLDATKRNLDVREN